MKCNLTGKAGKWFGYFWPMYLDWNVNILSRFIFDMSFDLIWAFIFSHGSVVVLKIHNPHKINIKIHILSSDSSNEDEQTAKALLFICKVLWLVSVFLYSSGVPAVYLLLFQPLGCENQAMLQRFTKTVICFKQMVCKSKFRMVSELWYSCCPAWVMSRSNSFSLSLKFTVSSPLSCIIKANKSQNGSKVDYLLPNCGRITTRKKVYNELQWHVSVCACKMFSLGQLFNFLLFRFVKY